MKPASADRPDSVSASTSGSPRFLSRRRLLAAGGLLLAAGAAGAWRVTRAPRTALAPWTFDPASLADPRLDAFRFAVLAPNPHNRQPWLIRLAGADEAVLTCDLDRRLPQTDPFDRQIVIGFGCFVEIAAIVAAERGYRLDVTPFPDGETTPRLDRRPVAHLRFVADATAEKDPLFAAILRRRTVREPYDLARPVGAEAIRALGATGAPGIRSLVLTADAQVGALRDLVVDAFRVETTTPRTMQESADLMRVGAAEIDANPDGIVLAGPLFEALSVASDWVRRQAMDPEAAATRSTFAKYNRAFAATPAFLATVSEGETRADAFAAGRVYVRAALLAASLGLSMQPVSQALQEFAEMSDLFARVHRAVGGPPAARVQMLARLGYGPAVAPAPRWPLESRLIRA